MMRSVLFLLWVSVLPATVFALAPGTEPVLSGENHTTRGFAPVSQPRQFEFPRDHGPHPDHQEEWWYVTGNLDGPNGERFGFELTFFRFALSPQQGGETDDQSTSRWRTRQLYMAHFALTDVDKATFRFDQRYAREALGLAGVQTTPLRIWLEDWSIHEHASGWRLNAAEDRYALSLELRPLMDPVLNGEQGLIRKSPDSSAASYYYSVPRLSVTGRLLRDGQPIDVRGLAWLDREWGSGALRVTETGWDWFALQLNDGSSFMFYALRDAQGMPTALSSGTWVDAQGNARRLFNEDVQIEVLRHWDSPRGGRYPAQWRLSVPPLALSLEVRPVLADQELDTRPRYWEGAVDVQGQRAGQPIEGRGYVELVGYAR